MRRLYVVVGALVVVALAVPLILSIVSRGGSDDRASSPTSSGSTATSSAVQPSAEAMYAQPGQCVELDVLPAGIVPRTQDCSAQAFTFVVAAALPSPTDPCGDGPYSQITQPGFGKLCVVPNFVEGDCYSIPSQTGTLADFRRSACGQPPATRGGQVIRVERRAAATTVDCPGGQVVAFAQPTPIAYCLARAD